jgi:tyrosine-protein phosphatase SIW14
MRLNTARARTYTAVLLVLVLASPAAARTRDTRSNGSVVKTSSIRIDNFGRVNPNYYRGAQPKGQDYANLAALGVKTVINLTSDDAQTNERSLTDHAGMRYFQIPMTTHQPPTPAQVTEFLKLVNDPVNQPVYVHCAGGRHRTGVMTAAYRMTQDGWAADQAFKEMKRYKFGADFLHPEFKQFVYGYSATGHAVAAEAAVATTKTGG